MRLLHKLLLLNILAACGVPGSDSVFTEGNPKIEAPDSTPAPVRTPVPPRAPTIVTKAYAGYYRKDGDGSRFLPCGTTQLLEITGTPIASVILRDRHRWNAIWEGAKLFAVFQGAIVTDTVAQSGTSEPRKRFYVVDVDSMRTWQRGDCNGMRIPEK